MAKIKEYHLFAGIGGGIYGGMLLNHKCVGAVEIMPYARAVLAQRKLDGWMDKGMDIDSHTDITKMNGKDIKGKFDILCGGFPCQAFSMAAHGKNIPEKNLWDHMFRVVQESEAPVVFGENVVLPAIEKAKSDLESVGYKVERICLGCEDLGADHRRKRFWLLAIKQDEESVKVFQKIAKQLADIPKLTGKCWTKSPLTSGKPVPVKEEDRRKRLLGIGNAQSPFVAAAAFRILVNRHLSGKIMQSERVSKREITRVFSRRKTWMTKMFRETEDGTKKIIGLVHTPTTMANYCYESMLVRHVGCRNYVKVFCDGRPETLQRPEPIEAEYLMGFPLGASSPDPLTMDNMNIWR